MFPRPCKRPKAKELMKRINSKFCATKCPRHARRFFQRPSRVRSMALRNGYLLIVLAIDESFFIIVESQDLSRVIERSCSKIAWLLRPDYLVINLFKTQTTDDLHCYSCCCKSDRVTESFWSSSWFITELSCPHHFTLTCALRRAIRSKQALSSLTLWNPTTDSNIGFNRADSIWEPPKNSTTCHPNWYTARHHVIKMNTTRAMLVSFLPHSKAEQSTHLAKSHLVPFVLSVADTSVPTLQRDITSSR